MLKLLGDGLAQIPPQVGKEPDLPHAARRVEPRGAAPGARGGRRGGRRGARQLPVGDILDPLPELGHDRVAVLLGERSSIEHLHAPTAGRHLGLPHAAEPSSAAAALPPSLSPN